MNRQSDLLEVVTTRHAASCLASRLDGRQQQADQNADDRNDHQQLHQSKTLVAPMKTMHKELLENRKEKEIDT